MFLKRSLNEWTNRASVVNVAPMNSAVLAFPSYYLRREYRFSQVSMATSCYVEMKKVLELLPCIALTPTRRRSQPQTRLKTLRSRMLVLTH